MKEELMAQAVTALVSLFVSSGITGIVYNVMKTQITSLKEELERNREDFNSRIKQLEEKLIKSQQKTNLWFRKFHMLKHIIVDNHCKNRECKVYDKFLEYQSTEGEVIEEYENEIISKRK